MPAPISSNIPTHTIMVMSATLSIAHNAEPPSGFRERHSYFGGLNSLESQPWLIPMDYPDVLNAYPLVRMMPRARVKTS